MHLRGRPQFRRRFHANRSAGRDQRADRRRDRGADRARRRPAARAGRARHPPRRRRACHLCGRHSPHLPVRPRDGATDRMTFTEYKSLADRVVIITGGASGIGETQVRAFVANGARVAFLDLQQDAGAALAAELAGARHAPHFVQCDLTDVEALRAALAQVRAALGPAAVLLNNAANDLRQTFGEVTPDQFDWMMAVNLRHVYFACQAVVPQMLERGGGSIINMSSMAWMFGVADL